MRRILFALLIAATPTLAAENADKPAQDAGGGGLGSNVNKVPYLMAPLKDANGKLSGYAYIVSRFTAASPAAALELSDKMAFIQDSFVRDVNRTQVPMTADGQVDIPALEGRLASDIKTVAGASKVKFVTVCTVQIATLHLKQAAPLADADDLAALPKSRCEAETPAK
jgi:hypothetical protein